MKTPNKLPSDGHSPVTFDIESSAKSRFNKKFLDNMAEDSDTGASDINWTSNELKQFIEKK